MNKSNEQFFFTFPRSEKLKSKIEIDYLFQSGKVVKSFPFRILCTLNKDTDSKKYPKVLVSIPKRKHKLAVTRNLLKRRVNESYRLNKLDFSNSLQNIQSISIIYVSNRTESFKFINDKLILGLERLSKILNQNHDE